MNQRSLFPRNIFLTYAIFLLLLYVLVACGAVAPEEPLPVVAPTQGPAVEEPSAPEPTAIAIPTQVILPTAIPAIPEQRKLTLEYPSQIRVGDSDVIRLTLEMDDLGNLTPTAQFAGNVVTGDVVEIPDLYETHHVVAEARFDIAGLQVLPSELFSQTLSRGQTVSFYWSIRPTDPGIYRGTIWFYLRFVDKVSGEESRRTVSAQIVEIEAVNILGLPAIFVRTIGGVGSVIGAVIGFPFFEDIVKFIFKRRRRIK